MFLIIHAQLMAEVDLYKKLCCERIFLIQMKKWSHFISLDEASFSDKIVTCF